MPQTQLGEGWNLLSSSFWVCHACMLSRFSGVLLCVTLRIIAPQAPLFTGILQARILEWVSMPSSRGSSQALCPLHWQASSANLLCLLHWQEIKPASLTSPAFAGKFFTTRTTQKTHILLHHQTTLQWSRGISFRREQEELLASQDHLAASWPHGWTKQLSHTGLEFLSATHSLWDSFSLCN